MQIIHEPIEQFLQKQRAAFQSTIYDWGEEVQRECEAHFGHFAEQAAAIDARFLAELETLSKDPAISPKEFLIRLGEASRKLESEMLREIRIFREMMTSCMFASVGITERVQ